MEGPGGKSLGLSWLPGSMACTSKGREDGGQDVKGQTV